MFNQQGYNMCDHRLPVNLLATSTKATPSTSCPGTPPFSVTVINLMSSVFGSKTRLQGVIKTHLLQKVSKSTLFIAREMFA